MYTFEMIAYSAFNRGSNYELISSTIDGEISATSRVEIVHVDMPLAYLIKAIFIKDATSLRKRRRKSLHLQKFIKSVRRLSSIIRVSSTIHANSYPILPLHYDHYIMTRLIEYPTLSGLMTQTNSTHKRHLAPFQKHHANKLLY